MRYQECSPGDYWLLSILHRFQNIKLNFFKAFVKVHVYERFKKGKKGPKKPFANVSNDFTDVRRFAGRFMDTFRQSNPKVFRIYSCSTALSWKSEMQTCSFYLIGISLDIIHIKGRDPLKRLTPTGEFIYSYAYHQDETELCQMEMRAFFGEDTDGKIIKSTYGFAPSRSPFIKERLEVLFEAAELPEIIELASRIEMGTATFKVIFPKINGLADSGQFGFEEKRDAERRIGFVIKGRADVHQPDVVFGLMPYAGRWYFGLSVQSESVWFKHQRKPREYSTALSTRVARAITNIAVPDPAGVKAIDPCCGIGTVLVEALSMGIDIVGRDINPLVVDGSRENIAHFGLTGEVELGQIADITEEYDVAIIDMPYNLYTDATPAEQQDILTHAHPVTERLVVVTIEPIDHMIEQAGFTIIDRCIAKKSLFLREILVCQRTILPAESAEELLAIS